MKFRKFVAAFTLGFAIGPVAVGGCDWTALPPAPAISPSTELALDAFDAWMMKTFVPTSVAPGTMNCGPRICPVDTPPTGTSY